MLSTKVKDIIFNLKNVVFAGGGLRGVSVLGALQALRDETGADFGSRTPKLTNVCGVSIGCLYALIICLGYNVSELTDLAFRLNQSDILDPDPLRIVSGELSVDVGLKLKSFIESLFVKKNFDPELSFEQLYQKTNINLHVVATNLTHASVEHITRFSYPHLSVIKGIMASMALPLVYPPIDSPNGDKWIDGGVLDNYPIQMYDANETLGFNFTWNLDATNFSNIPRLLLRIIQVMQIPNEVASWSLLSNEHKKRTVRIMTGVSSALESALTSKEITPETRLILQQAGFFTMKKKLKNWFTEENSENFDYGKDRTLPTYLYSCTYCSPPENALCRIYDETWSSKKNNTANDERSKIQH